MRSVSVGLGLKFSVAVTVLIMLTMIGIDTLIINYQEEALRQNMFEGNIAMTKNLAHDAAEPLLVFDPLQLDVLVKTVREATSCSYAMIADKDGRIVAHNVRARIGSQLGEEEYRLSAGAGVKMETRIRDFISDGEPMKEFSHPVSIGSEALGAAMIAYSVNDLNAVIEKRLSKLKKYIYLITAMMLLTGIAGGFLVSGLLTRPLKRLKDRMLDVQSGNLNVEVENPRIVKCWERMKCHKTDCPSHGKLRCWAVAGTFCHGDVQGAFAQKIGDCRKCVVYRESCGDEIDELVEVFNQMLKDLRYNLDALEKANAEKAKMERLSALGEMAATVAHETKNPLNAIKIAAAYLRNNFHGSILKEFLGIIEQEVTRLNDISSNFLGFSKPPPLLMRPCSINAIVETTVDLIREEATARNIEIVLLKDENIPSVKCDYSRIKQAVLNLLINAMDASRAGDTISITTEAGQETIGIVVSDTGIGISESEIGSIFKPFYSTKTRGSGLGLSIVERIVKEHGGEIEVQSSPGKGTTFKITLKVLEYAKV